MKKEYVAKLDKTAASKLANRRKQKEHKRSEKCQDRNQSVWLSRKIDYDSLDKLNVWMMSIGFNAVGQCKMIE